MKLLRQHLLGLALLLGIAHGAGANVIITGVLDGNPNDGTPGYMYKAIEFYAAVTIPAAAVDNYFLREHTEASGLFDYPVFDLVNGDPSGNILAGSFFYAIPPNFNPSGPPPLAGFFELYDAVTGNPNPTYVTTEIIHEGDAWYQLMYDDGSGEVVVDQFGDAASLTDPTWNYNDMWVGRADETGPDGTYIPSNWPAARRILFNNQTLAYHANNIPFGEYQHIIPEQSVAPLLMLGGLGLLLRRSKR